MSDQDVALQGWHSVTEKPRLRTQVVMPPVDWPMGLNKLLDPKFKFPSPTVSTFFNSMLAWQRLLIVGRNDRYEEGTKSWWSRLCRNGQVLKLEDGGAYMVLVVGQWGLMGLPVEVVEAGPPERWGPQGKEPLKMVYVVDYDMGTWKPTVRPVVGRPAPQQHGILLDTAEDGVSLLRSACLRRYDWSLWEVKRVVKHFSLDAGSRFEMIMLGREMVFDGKDALLPEMKDKYMMPAPAPSTQEDVDAELMALMEEMGLTDTMNATEWSEDKKRAEKMKLKKLNKRRDDAWAVKQFRQKTKRKLKPGLVKKFAIQKKRLPKRPPGA